MLAFYSERLTGVEMNNTFYRFPAPGLVETWLAATPTEFRFALKAQRSLTYSGAAFDRRGAAEDFGRRATWFGERLGPVLVQFPPPRTLDLDLLDTLLGALAVPAAAEFRHASWFVPETYALLGAHGGAMVVTDDDEWPMAPGPGELPIAYYRLRRDYDDEALGRWTGVIRSDLAGRTEAHVYFKHEVGGPELARRLVEMISAE